jgi:hypothetical protein
MNIINPIYNVITGLLHHIIVRHSVTLYGNRFADKLDPIYIRSIINPTLYWREYDDDTHVSPPTDGGFKAIKEEVKNII